jgi:hypothetical protein
MVSTNDYLGKPGVPVTADATPPRQKKRRFGLFAALAAPFTDIDERAMHKKRPRGHVRNNSKGNMFAPRAAGPAKMPIKSFPRGDV